MLNKKKSTYISIKNTAYIKLPRKPEMDTLLCIVTEQLLKDSEHSYNTAHSNFPQ